jgi:hypothetical protein
MRELSKGKANAKGSCIAENNVCAYFVECF